MPIPALDASTPAAEIAAALERDGCLVLTNYADEKTRGPLITELEAALASTPAPKEKGPEDFYSGNTKRLPGLIVRTPAVRPFVTDPRLLGVCDTFLLPNCPVHPDENVDPSKMPGWKRYQLNLCTALSVGPGAREQKLHREDDLFPFFPVPRPSVIVASILALTDFTEENGSTLLVPGSHKWPGERKARPEEVCKGTMPAGSLLVWLGGTLHGAGKNGTKENWRMSVFTSYSCGWLRTEENQSLDIPPKVAKTLSKELRALAGYHMYNNSLGFFDPTLDDYISKL